MSEAPVDLNEELSGCARYGELDDVLAIISEGGNVNYVDASGSSPLHYAAANGHVAVVQVLLDRGAMVRANASGNTPLHWAALNGHEDVAKALLAREDLDVLAKNAFGKSALTEALNGGHEGIARLILSHTSVGESAASASAAGGAAASADGSTKEGESEDGMEETTDDVDDEDTDLLPPAPVGSFASAEIAPTVPSDAAASGSEMSSPSRDAAST